MKIGTVYPPIELAGDPDAVRRYALATEALGYDHVLAYDHVLGASHDREPKLWGPYTEKDPFHDPLIMFAGAEPLKHLARVKHHLQQAGRSLDGFGLEFITNAARSVNEVVERAKRWQDAGGTHPAAKA